MALPIAATPVLTGKDAERFYKEMAENEKRGVSDEVIDRIIKNSNEIIAQNPQIKRTFGIDVI
jgi:hypothetical protein